MYTEGQTAVPAVEHNKNKITRIPFNKHMRIIFAISLIGFLLYSYLLINFIYQRGNESIISGYCSNKESLSLCTRSNIKDCCTDNSCTECGSNENNTCNCHSYTGRAPFLFLCQCALLLLAIKHSLHFIKYILFGLKLPEIEEDNSFLSVISNIIDRFKINLRSFVYLGMESQTKVYESETNVHTFNIMHEVNLLWTGFWLLYSLQFISSSIVAIIDIASGNAPLIAGGCVIIMLNLVVLIAVYSYNFKYKSITSCTISGWADNYGHFPLRNKYFVFPIYGRVMIAVFEFVPSVVQCAIVFGMDTNNMFDLVLKYWNFVMGMNGIFGAASAWLDMYILFAYLSHDMLSQREVLLLNDLIEGFYSYGIFVVRMNWKTDHFVESHEELTAIVMPEIVQFPGSYWSRKFNIYGMLVIGIALYITIIMPLSIVID